MNDEPVPATPIKATSGGPLRRLYNWLMLAAQGPHALWVVALVAFAESSFFPIPPDPLLVPMILARPQRAWRYAGVCTVSSVIGGIAGYAIGYFLYATFGHWVVETYGLQRAFASFQATFAVWGAWIICLKGLTPIPYKLVTIASGMAHFDFGTFLIASIVARGGRFFVTAALLRRYGEPIRAWIERSLLLTVVILIAAIGVGMLAIGFLG
ncbi:MAG: DedA family protein [Azospirillaceae bacterium]|nr:DedA family protein [Azospirillaceae bacterium]